MTDKTSVHTIRRATLADAPAIASVHIRSWQSSYLGILPPDFLAALNVEHQAPRWKRNLTASNHATFVGTTPNGQVVGFCHAGPNRDEPKVFQGEVYAIYLLDEAKRQGLGCTLFHEATAWLGQKGFHSFLVWVLTTNVAARRFYETLGGRQLSERPVSIGCASYAEVAYGWSSG